MQHNTPKCPNGHRAERIAGFLVIALGILVAGLWMFPHFWYTGGRGSANPVWLVEGTNVAGWAYRGVPIAESAERMLVADRTVSGEFSNAESHREIRVFSSKRYSEKPNDIGLFVHTPDRCWTQGGWQLEPATPDFVEIEVHGLRMVLERRIFVAGTQRELVYFGGMVGGQPLPYRLDYNLSVGMKYALRRKSVASATHGTELRFIDTRFWRSLWDSFVTRSQMLGPKQFIRISTSLVGAEIEEADRLLQSFLARWLDLGDFQAELKAWTGGRF